MSEPVPTPRPIREAVDVDVEFSFDETMINHKANLAHEEEPPSPLRLLDEPNGHDAEDHDERQPIDLTGTKRAKIRWTIEEMRIVAVGVAYYCRKQGFRRLPDEDDYEGRKFLKEFVAAAQLAIPGVSPGLAKDRRRIAAPLQGYSQIFWKLTEDAMTPRAELPLPVSAPADSGTMAATPPIPAAPAVEVAPPPPAPAMPVPPAGYALVDEKDPLGKVPLGALALAFMARLMTEVERGGRQHVDHAAFSELMADEMNVLRRQNQELTKRVSELEVGLKNALNVARTPLPKVALIGCTPDYFQQVRSGAEEAGLRIALRFYEQGSSARTVSDDWAIVTRWAGHDWDGKAKEAVSTGRYIRIVGSASAIVEQLKTWFKP